MGQTLSEPVTTKKTACCRNDNFRVGSSSMQGWRVSMEDSHVHILSLPDDPGTAFFGVYDGHGGAAISQHISKHLHEYITNRIEYQNGNISLAIQKAFLELDKDMQHESILREKQAGSTAITLLIKDNILYSANAGDSRAVACVRGHSVPLSLDHKPNLVLEKKRIEAAGGWVELGRVNRHLALSRAFGDFMFKQNNRKTQEEQIVTVLPDVKEFELTEDWEFLILACDGIWDVMKNQDVVKFVRSRLAACQQKIDGDQEQKFVDPEEICEELLKHCLAPDVLMEIGCDNMTVVLVCLLHGKPYSHLVTKCQQPPAESVFNSIGDASTILESCI
ncbi:probable protein phosphatase 2C T23F11.1 [Leptopilina boulardi]|uniref:probable protein phosphatase 2C T23F11.1 n=1 Tax=Leptopilina boulardi TaxID=63433 RepID=UPI0021F60198|nr:probable protein phosphatase 2C T23F11.1 [Leptopilina boulardi]XP_051169261.1 probable protein phosphatase 2C T23F11.1 [Leptopilina boulardi]XP_051169262.1 probable protein phosphatase 2C T23F11.1 [Leptopilina boulardi]